jgi:hypothetical protein
VSEPHRIINHGRGRGLGPNRGAQGRCFRQA